MNLMVTIDWKSIIALGASVVGTILVAKIDPIAAERVSIHLIDAGKELALAGNSER